MFTFAAIIISYLSLLCLVVLLCHLCQLQGVRSRQTRVWVIGGWILRTMSITRVILSRPQWDMWPGCVHNPFHMLMPYQTSLPARPELSACDSMLYPQCLHLCMHCAGDQISEALLLAITLFLPTKTQVGCGWFLCWSGLDFLPAIYKSWTCLDLNLWRSSPASPR